MLQTSVIIPSFNRADALELTLLALAEQTVSPDQFEVIVVDDGSSDRSVEVTTSLCLPYPLRLIRQPNRGPGAARNQGAQHAQAELLIFLDADMIPARDLLQRYLVSFNNHSQAIVIGRKLPWLEAFNSRFDQVFNYVLAGDPGPEAIQPEWYYLASGNFAVGARVFKALGGFDEQFRMCEDVDLAFRAYQRGIEFLYNPTAVGYHNHPKTLEQLCSNLRSSAWWTAQLMDKHPALWGQIPVYREVEPVRPGVDSARLVVRKLARHLLAKPIPMAALKMGASVLERSIPNPALLEFFYWKITSGYRVNGFHEELNSRQQLNPSAIGTTTLGCKTKR